MTDQGPLRGTVAALAARMLDEVAGHEARAAAALESARARQVRLQKAVHDLDRAATLSAVLDTLARAAQRESRRAAVVLLRDGMLHPWRAPGFDGTPDAARAGGIAADALAAGQLVTRADAAGSPAFAQPARGPILMAPLVLGGEAVALLYADHGAADDGAGDSGDEAADEPVGEPADQAAGHGTVGVRPTPAEGEERVDAQDGPASGAVSDWALALDLLARHAARCLEALTAFRTARFVARQIGRASREARGEEQAARRYARLLVSEIKLYHERTIVEGRQARDLSSRLGGEIARAQALYDQRVPEDVRARTDFFRAELVRTLASGDASLLGPSPARPPGPVWP